MGREGGGGGGGGGTTLLGIFLFPRFTMELQLSLPLSAKTLATAQKRQHLERINRKQNYTSQLWCEKSGHSYITITYFMRISIVDDSSLVHELAFVTWSASASSPPPPAPPPLSVQSMHLLVLMWYSGWQCFGGGWGVNLRERKGILLLSVHRGEKAC